MAQPGVLLVLVVLGTIMASWFHIGRGGQARLEGAL